MHVFISAGPLYSPCAAWCFQASIIICKIYPATQTFPGHCGTGAVLEPIITHFGWMRRWEWFLRGSRDFASGQLSRIISRWLYGGCLHYYQGVFMMPKTHTHVFKRIHARNLRLKSTNWTHHNVPRSSVCPPSHCRGFS